MEQFHSISPCNYKLIMQPFPRNCNYTCSLLGLLQFPATVYGMLHSLCVWRTACGLQTSASLAMERTTGGRWTTLWVEGSVRGGTSSTLISTSTSQRSMHPFNCYRQASLLIANNNNNNKSILIFIRTLSFFPGILIRVWTTTTVVIRTPLLFPGATPQTLKWKERAATSACAVRSICFCYCITGEFTLNFHEGTGQFKNPALFVLNIFFYTRQFLFFMFIWNWLLTEMGQ